LPNKQEINTRLSSAVAFRAFPSHSSTTSHHNKEPDIPQTLQLSFCRQYSTKTCTRRGLEIAVSPGSVINKRRYIDHSGCHLN
jgi:hypothetical protein